MATAQKNITLNVEGMTCSNCAKSVSRHLENQKVKDINVNFSLAEVSFTLNRTEELEKIIKGINGLGYKVVDKHIKGENKVTAVEKKFYFSLIFSIPLFFHMFLPWDLLQDPIVQLTLCVPVFVLSCLHYGKSAFKSIKNGLPNMDVLIFMGASAAFIYSLAGTILYWGNVHLLHQYLFYETAATITSLALLGSVLEHRSVKQTTTAIGDLTKLQVSTANKIGPDNKIMVVSINDIATNDVLQVNLGDRIAADGEIVGGNCSVDESMITGESEPVYKNVGDKVIAGTVVINGNIRLRVEQTGKETTLSKIIELVRNAQKNKPTVQKLGDKVSGIFVPSVLSIATLTFFIAFFVFDVSLQQSLMQGISVLVVSCPCAMGLATPTAVMSGIGRAAKKGILIKGGDSLEKFAGIKNIVFDKTGTLTTGEFRIKDIVFVNNFEEQQIKNILFSLEQHSSHPIAKSILKELKDQVKDFPLTDIEEEKGLGIKGKDQLGNVYALGSYKMAEHLTKNNSYSLYLLINGNLASMVALEDRIRKNAKESVQLFKEQGVTSFMLSGDKKEKSESLSKELGIEHVYSQQTPEEKLKKVEELVKQVPTAMVGDGINDAPALAQATVGISLGNSTQIAIQSAQIILLSENDLTQLNQAHLISKATLKTIKQNLFWAFFYNIVAIPIAAFGFLSPMVAALSMAFSDVIVIGNSIWLKTKKIND